MGRLRHRRAGFGQERAVRRASSPHQGHRRFRSRARRRRQPAGIIGRCNAAALDRRTWQRARRRRRWPRRECRPGDSRSGLRLAARADGVTAARRHPDRRARPVQKDHTRKVDLAASTVAGQRAACRNSHCRRRLQSAGRASRHGSVGAAAAGRYRSARHPRGHMRSLSPQVRAAGDRCPAREEACGRARVEQSAVAGARRRGTQPARRR